nr:roadblock/LC7 domain-containing protein [Angustibacter aerolatus]
MSTEAANFAWLLDNFVKSVPGVKHTLVVSADGLLMAMSDELDRTAGDQAGRDRLGHVQPDPRGRLASLRGGEVRQAIVEMDTQFMFLMNISDGSVLSVAADATCDVGLIGYEMALLVSRTEATLTPQPGHRDALAPPRLRGGPCGDPGVIPVDPLDLPADLAEDEADDDTYAVRPYAVTGGRTRTSAKQEALPVEALVQSFGGDDAVGLTPERRKIIALTSTQFLSVAEPLRARRAPGRHRPGAHRRHGRGRPGQDPRSGHHVPGRPSNQPQRPGECSQWHFLALTSRRRARPRRPRAPAPRLRPPRRPPPSSRSSWPAGSPSARRPSSVPSRTSSPSARRPR